MILLPLAHRAIRMALLRLGVRARSGTYAGHRVEFYELDGRGDAPPVVLVHGLGGSANSWAPLLPALRKLHKRVLVPDMPGFGLSTLPEGAKPPTDRDLFAVLHDFVRDEVREPAVLVGNSLGGAMSGVLAMVRPEMVAGLALISPAGAPMTAEELEALRRDFRSGTWRSGRQMIKRLFHRPPLSAWIFAADLAEHWASSSIEAVLEEVSPDVHLDGPTLSGLQMPIVLLWGASERILPARGIEHFQKWLPKHARIELVERAGHVAQIERPRAVLARLRWLASEAIAHQRKAA